MLWHVLQEKAEALAELRELDERRAQLRAALHGDKHASNPATPVPSQDSRTSASSVGRGGERQRKKEEHVPWPYTSACLETMHLHA